MVFSHFRTQSSIRVVFLGLTLAVFVYLGLDTDFYATLVLVGVLIIYQVVPLIHSVELTNRQLTRFLQSIEYADLSQTFTGRKLGSSFDELYTAFTEVTNAIQALQDHSAPTIQLIGGQDTQGRLVIQVTNNGPGILQDVQEKIFIPFFTTKQGGSGIGLSLSRQIMRMHRGTITVVSTPDVQTTFTLRF